MSKEYDFLIVGSGLAGSVFAHEASCRGKKCLVLEKKDHLGGNIYTKEIEGIDVHNYGAHIFHTDNERVWDYVNRFTKFNNFVNSPVANYNGQIYNLPFNMNTFSKLWGIATPTEAAKIISEQCSQIKGEPQNLEEQAISLVGVDVFLKLIKGYTEKQWGTSCANLPPSIIRRIPVRFTYDNNYFNDRYQGIPIKGYNKIIEALLARADVVLGVDFNYHRDEYLSKANEVVYTGMLDEYFDFEYGNLEYRSLRFEHETIDEYNHQGVAVMNYTDTKTPFTRIIEHKHFVHGKQSKTVITKEYPAKYEPGMEAYYPINDERNRLIFSEYELLAKTESNVHFCGRLAEYKYYDMDDVILKSLELADKVLP